MLIKVPRSRPFPELPGDQLGDVPQAQKGSFLDQFRTCRLADFDDGVGSTNAGLVMPPELPTSPSRQVSRQPPQETLK